jgi:hypothetical protein
VVARTQRLQLRHRRRRFAPGALPFCSKPMASPSRWVVRRTPDRNAPPRPASQFVQQLRLPARPACVAYQMGAAVALELAAGFTCLVLAEYTPDMAPDKFTYFYWQALRYPR